MISEIVNNRDVEMQSHLKEKTMKNKTYLELKTYDSILDIAKEMNRLVAKSNAPMGRIATSRWSNKNGVWLAYASYLSDALSESIDATINLSEDLRNIEYDICMSNGMILAEFPKIIVQNTEDFSEVDHIYDTVKSQMIEELTKAFSKSVWQQNST